MRLETVYCQRRGSLERAFPKELFKAAWEQDVLSVPYAARVPREEEMQHLWTTAKLARDHKDTVEFLTEYWFWTYAVLKAAMQASEGVE
jgi:hypothetical protein